MPPLPNIDIEYRHHRGEERMFLSFDYDVMLTHVCKDLGAKFSATYKAWHLPAGRETSGKVMDAFRQKAWLRWPSQARHEKKKSDQRKSVSRKFREVELTEAQSQSMEIFRWYIESRGLSKSTYINYRDLLLRMFGFLEKDPTEITNRDIQRFQSEFLVRNNYAESTQRQFATAVRSLFEANGLPRVYIDEVRSPTKSRQLPKTMTRGEIMDILSACQNNKHRTMLSLMYSTGIRVNELIHLHLSDLDFERKVIHVRRAKGRKDRRVVMGLNMAEMLKNYINEYRPYEFVFNGKGHLKYTASSVRGALHLAARRAGVKKRVTPHMLRHSFATHMIEDGVNLRYVQELLGHTRPETTQIYTHVASDELMKLKNPFDELMKLRNQRSLTDNNLTNPTSLYRNPLE